LLRKLANKYGVVLKKWLNERREENNSNKSWFDSLFFLWC
jgi:hypothetical protein